MERSAGIGLVQKVACSEVELETPGAGEKSCRSVRCEGVVPDDFETASNDWKAGRPTVLRHLNLHACVHVDMYLCHFSRVFLCMCMFVYMCDVSNV